VIKSSQNRGKSCPRVEYRHKWLPHFLERFHSLTAPQRARSRTVARRARGSSLETSSNEKKQLALGAAIEMGGLENRLGYVLRRAQLWVFRDIINQMAGFDIKPAQFSVLTIIGTNPGITQRNLGRSLEIEPARLVLMLDELERRGLTRREQPGNDRRSRILFLTAKGRKQLGQLTAIADEHETRLLPHISPEERAQLLKILQSVGQGQIAAQSHS